jgi:hypothetical protein
VIQCSSDNADRGSRQYKIRNRSDSAEERDVRSPDRNDEVDGEVLFGIGPLG